MEEPNERAVPPPPRNVWTSPGVSAKYHCTMPKQLLVMPPAQSCRNPAENWIWKSYAKRDVGDPQYSAPHQGQSGWNGFCWASHPVNVQECRSSKPSSNGAPRRFWARGLSESHTLDRPRSESAMACAMSPLLASQASSEGWFRSRMIISRWSSHFRVPLASEGEEPPNAPSP